ncbi:hypothetical protein GCM10010123_08000 [Pilimelia anulata]|uniref:Uncharacterized protein n=1 Tax=Pilimelia anulata TaxID=53371 RepID=A0A8J3F8R2_9ACTN|nr:hypothetical protein [Pilimelia anulata]GGJ80464.1 hypothetical protein GCM10010123_08000 [Pilimelia anulata]
MTNVELLVQEARDLLNHPQLPTWEEEHLRLSRASALIGLAQLAELSRITTALESRLPAAAGHPGPPAGPAHHGPAADPAHHATDHPAPPHHAPPPPPGH